MDTKPVADLEISRGGFRTQRSSVQSTLQNAKDELSRVVWGHAPLPPRKILMSLKVESGD